MDHHFLVTRGKKKSRIFLPSSPSPIPSATLFHLVNSCSSSSPSRSIFLNEDSDEGIPVFRRLSKAAD